MKNILFSTNYTMFLLVYLVISSPVNCQEIDMDFIPKRLESVSEADYTRGKYYLQNSYTAMRESKNTTYADYWNIGIAYSYMGQSQELILSYFHKAKSIDQKSFCGVVAYGFQGIKEIKEHRLYKILGIGLSDLISDCDLAIERTSLDSRIKEKDEMNLRGLDEKLIDRLIQLIDKDQYYRYSGSSYKDNWGKQNKLDAEVSASLIKIFDEYGYPGKKLVGEKFMNFGCLLLEHGAKLETQEKYFPLVVEALRMGEVKKPYVRMLVDRIHWKKTGKQIFGSHGSIPFDDEKTIQQYREKYGL